MDGTASYVIICDFTTKSSRSEGSPYRSFKQWINTCKSLKSCRPAWKVHQSSTGHRCSLEKISFNVSRGGIEGPGPVSVLKPDAPPRSPSPSVVSCIKNSGTTYSYGPVCFTPLGPVTKLGVSIADDRIGFGHRCSRSMFRYIVSIFGGGGPSLPFSHTRMLG